MSLPISTLAELVAFMKLLARSKHFDGGMFKSNRLSVLLRKPREDAKRQWNLETTPPTLHSPLGTVLRSLRRNPPPASRGLSAPAGQHPSIHARSSGRGRGPHANPVCTYTESTAPTNTLFFFEWFAPPRLADHLTSSTAALLFQRWSRR